ncbi:hypothetical protein [Pseudoalteromonas sp. SR43-5]|uniref:hypothetical protein n=1 Tax=Pseudoalteromonas sp. SR43-5 TaxID=2760941 RepID=UPI0015FADA5B|nr:hypothetical protein [Pseudoalteromonas sp. SR43-5]MBB1307273.1 hypothetical protein [Pseudoalteromonas sp. SR43-5]
MIILQLTTTEFLGALTLISVLMFAAVLLAYAMGAGSVNVDLEVKRKRNTVESCGFGAPPPAPPPRRQDYCRGFPIPPRPPRQPKTRISEGP